MWGSYKAVNGLLLTVMVPVTVSLILFVFSELGFWWKIALSVGALLCVVLLVLLLTLYDAARKNYKGYAEAHDDYEEAQRKYEEAHEQAKNSLPRILYSSESASHEPTELVCLLEPSELFSHDILVSFYDIKEEGREVLIGVGVVENVQTEDGKILVAMTFPMEGYQEEVSRLKRNDAAALQRTKVKPNVPRTYLLRSILQGGP